MINGQKLIKFSYLLLSLSYFIVAVDDYPLSTNNGLFSNLLLQRQIDAILIMIVK